MAFFPDVPKIQYEGPDSKNPLAFRHYNAERSGRRQDDEGAPALRRLLLAHLPRHGRRSVRPRLRRAAVGRRHRLASRWRSSASDVAFEFMEKLGVPFYCFHDRDVAPEGKNLARDQRQPRRASSRRSRRSSSGPASSCSGARPTCSATRASSTGRRRAATPTCSPTPRAQVKKALEVTKELGGENYVFWGGREGYSNLYNTDLKRELDHLAKFFHLAVEYKKKIGFTRPVPDRAEAEGADRPSVRLRRRRVLAFLRGYGLDEALQAQRRDQPRDAGRAHDDARAGLRVAATACSARSTPTAATCCSAGTPISSRPTST